MKFSNIFFAITLTTASLGITATAKADTVNARCDVYPKGDRYDLVPVGEQPGTYRDQNANPLLSLRDA